MTRERTLHRKKPKDHFQIPKRLKAPAMDRLTYLLRESGDQMIHLVITYNGHFDFVRLQKAVEWSFDAEPILGCRFVEHPRKPFWERMEKQGWKAFCELINSRDLEKELHAFVIEPLDPTKELPVKIRLFRQAQSDVLCLKVSHTAMDGAGMIEYLQLLGELYQKAKEQPNYQVRPNLQGSRGLEQVLKHFRLRKKTSVFLQHRSPKPGWAFPWVDTKRTRRTYSLRRLSEERFQRIKQFAKERKATINDLLLAAFYRALFKIAKAPYGEPMVNVVTVNLRSYLASKKAEAICNLSTSVYPYFAIEKNESFEQTLEKAQQVMQQFKENLPGIGSAFFVNNFFGRITFKRLKAITLKLIQKHLETKKTHPIFTNVGLVKAEQLQMGDLKAIDAYLITPIMFAPGFIFGMITFEKKMTFSIGFCEDSYPRESIELFLDYFCAELPK